MITFKIFLKIELSSHLMFINYELSTLIRLHFLRIHFKRERKKVGFATKIKIHVIQFLPEKWRTV